MLHFFSYPVGRRVLLFAVLLLLSGLTSANADQVNIDQLITKARAQQIWSQREWQVLMHYKPDLFGAGSVSLVDDTEFFRRFT